MRFPVSYPNALADQERLVAAFAPQLHGGPAAEAPPTRHSSELPQTLVYGLSAAAAYLGTTPSQLRVWLEYGGSLETIARVQDRPVEAVVDIFVEHAASRLAPLVAAGWLLAAQESTLLTGLRERLGAPRWEAARARDAA